MYARDARGEPVPFKAHDLRAEFACAATASFLRLHVIIDPLLERSDETNTPVLSHEAFRSRTAVRSTQPRRRHCRAQPSSSASAGTAGTPPVQMPSYRVERAKQTIFVRVRSCPKFRNAVNAGKKPAPRFSTASPASTATIPAALAQLRAPLSDEPRRWSASLPRAGTASGAVHAGPQGRHPIHPTSTVSGGYYSPPLNRGPHRVHAWRRRHDVRPAARGSLNYVTHRPRTARPFSASTCTPSQRGLLLLVQISTAPSAAGYYGYYNLASRTVSVRRMRLLPRRVAGPRRARRECGFRWMLTF